MRVTPLPPALLGDLLSQHPEIRRLLVGYSGGVDSHVLLHLLATQRQQWPDRALAAVYVDHGLQTASAAWGEHCAQICHELGIPLRMLSVNARPAPGESPEAAARQARYAAFAAALGADAALLTAHHRDDQAETLLLQLLRGAGPHGLAAMPTAARLGRGWLWRPLLEVERVDLLSYARAQRLRWIEDASNTDLRFDRNYLRREILPLFRERWPAFSRNLARSARLCAETAAWLDTEAATDLVHVATHQAQGLHIPALRELDERRQRNLLRFWLRQLGLPLPDSRQLRHILQDTLTAGRDRQPWIRWPGGEARRFRDTLYALPPLAPFEAGAVFLWRPNATGYAPLDLPGLGRLHMRAMFGVGLRAAVLADTVLTVRFRQGGERFQLAGRSHSRELKDLLREAGIPPWERERRPLLYQDQTLLAVVGLGVAATASAAPTEAGFLPVLETL